MNSGAQLGSSRDHIGGCGVDQCGLNSVAGGGFSAGHRRGAHQHGVHWHGRQGSAVGIGFTVGIGSEMSTPLAGEVLLCPLGSTDSTAGAQDHIGALTTLVIGGDEEFVEVFRAMVSACGATFNLHNQCKLRLLLRQLIGDR